MPVHNLAYQETDILIWGKTAPQLSNTYFETVCTGGVLRDGTPVRLYPIPFRYLEGPQKFARYQWITARIAKDPRDHRPESYRIDCDSIVVHETIPTHPKNGWAARASAVFRKKDWLFDSVEELQDAERRGEVSIGVVRPKEIIDLKPVERSPQDEAKWLAKAENLRARVAADADNLRLFESSLPSEMKSLDFMSHRMSLKWRCHGPNCKSHEMQILDWEVAEVQRKWGDEQALYHLADFFDPEFVDMRLFLGNLKGHPTRFMIVGLWYPRVKAQTALEF